MVYNLNVFQPYLLPQAQRINLPWNSVFNPLANLLAEEDDPTHPIRGDIHDVHMIGRQTTSTHIDYFNDQPGIYNCAAFVWGREVNGFIPFSYNDDGFDVNVLKNEEDIKKWIRSGRLWYGDHPNNDNNILPTFQKVLNTITITPVQVNLPTANNWDLDQNVHGVRIVNGNTLYVPQLNDVAVYVSTAEEINGEVCHVALYTNLDAITGLQLGLRWYSKCGQEYLVAHSLERMDIAYPRDNNFHLNFHPSTGNNFRGTINNQGIGAMENIFNTEGYGKLAWIIR